MTYLDDEERKTLFAAVMDLVSYDYAAGRPAPMSRLPGRIRMVMPQSPLPAVQLDLDLAFLAGIERLEDGKVPLTIYLRSILDLFGAVNPEAAATIRFFLSNIEASSVGAPDVRQPTEEEVKEAVVHQNDMLPLAFARLALSVSAAVAKLEVARIENGALVMTAQGKAIYLGTGWLVGKGVLLTNYHVFNARLKGEPPAAPADFEAQALGATVRFGYEEEDVAGDLAPPVELLAADAGLDYALLRVDSGDRDPIPVTLDLPTAAPGHVAAAVNIVQHPGGQPLRLGIRNNLIGGVTNTDLRYFTDTEGGSSGSPVLSDEWRAVALHRGTSLAAGVKFQGRDAVYINVGTRMSAIAAHLKANHAAVAGELALS
ncbi:MAG TPA: trypsin-like peptidase domain-containing protein [Allosphingosinicella sp.]|jgi:V8-like Glu-specific endopeptidase